jgi:hypothetical protein
MQEYRGGLGRHNMEGRGRKALLLLRKEYHQGRSWEPGIW